MRIEILNGGKISVNLFSVPFQASKFENKYKVSTEKYVDWNILPFQDFDCIPTRNSSLILSGLLFFGTGYNN